MCKEITNAVQNERVIVDHGTVQDNGLSDANARTDEHGRSDGDVWTQLNIEKSNMMKFIWYLNEKSQIYRGRWMHRSGWMDVDILQNRTREMALLGVLVLDALIGQSFQMRSAVKCFGTKLLLDIELSTNINVCIRAISMQLQLYGIGDTMFLLLRNPFSVGYITCSLD